MLKGRTPFEKVIRDTRGKEVGAVSIEHVFEATPLLYEWRYIWLKRAMGPVSGIFIRRLHIAPKERGRGYGTLLLREAIDYSHKALLPLYIDVPGRRMDLRRWLRSFGFSENIFWHNTCDTPMVRYRYY